MLRNAATAALVLAAAAGTAHAGALELLDFACNPDGAHKATAISQARTDCELTEGAKTACEVVDGSPFTCFTASSLEDTYTCRFRIFTVEVSAGTPGALGWTVEGTVSVAFAHYTKFKGHECRLDLREPSVDEGGGGFVLKAGKATLTAVYTASGEGHIKFLGGKVFGKKYTETCEGSVDADGHTTSRTRGCTTDCDAARALDGVCAPAPAPTDDDVEPAPLPAPTESTPRPVAVEERPDDPIL